MQLSFFGAAREVTGSCSMVEAAGITLLVDCGMFQGSDFNEKRNNDSFPFDPADIRAVLVTHAHLDHVGRLPLLVKRGFTGFVYATPPTVELVQLILEDALDVMTYNHQKLGSAILYGSEDIAATMQRFKAMEYHEDHELAPGVQCRFYDVGHIFGSAFIEIRADGKKAIFSGDVGNKGVPILRETEMLPPDIDAMICESTYGNRQHESTEERQELLHDVIFKAVKRGGTLMIPAFSLERTQELLYDLNDLIDRKQVLPRVPIFLDSPLAINAMKVYRKYPQYYDEEALHLFNDGDDLFQFRGLLLTEAKEESKRINQVPGPKIVIAGAGMMNGGRIVHHALRYLSDEKSTLLFVGYQAENTLGRRILNGESPVEVMGERVAVRCHIKALGALSAHADQEKLLDWIGGAPTLPKKVYLNHGEPVAAGELAKRLTTELGVKAITVDLGMSVAVK